MFSSLSLTSIATLVAALASVTPAAAKDERTFAVLRFHGDGPLTIGRTDPIVSPGGPSSHVHVVQGSNGFSNSATGESLLKDSTCSTANIAGDKSAYWMPQVFFKDPKNGSFEPVPLFYMNVYYFFEATNDDIKAFPVGLQMVSGNAMARSAPATGNDQLDPSKGPIQPAQFTCPRSSYDPPSYPANSDGSMAGIQDTGNKGAGAGFPFAECDGYASPLRADLHFPSCYDPSKDLTDYKSNTAFPTDAGSGKADCPEGWLHMPHIFYEMYWNTPLFADRWDPSTADSQPFVLSNGDAAGFSLHGDFMAAWDTEVLQHIIDTCNEGDSGMDKCAGVETVLEGNCHVDNPTPETVTGVMAALPGNNPLFGWQYGAGSSTGGSTTGSGSGSGSGSSGTTTTAAGAASSPANSASNPKTDSPSSPSSSPSVASTKADAISAAASSSSSPVVAVGAASPTSSSSAVEKAASPSSSPSSAPAPPSSLVVTPASSSAAPPPPPPAATTSAAAEAEGAGQSSACPAPTDVSTTVVTVPVTVYSKTTSTIYVTESAPYPTTTASAIGAAKRSEHMHRHAHARRH